MQVVRNDGEGGCRGGEGGGCGEECPMRGELGLQSDGGGEEGEGEDVEKHPNNFANLSAG